MSLRPQELGQVPEDTARVAHAAFPNGNPYLTLHDELGVIYEDEMFASLFTSSRGRPAESPGRLALVTALQFAEDLSDRRAADAVRGRIDWKYLLGLKLTDPGFDYSVLSEFRDRVLAGGMERQLLDVLLERLKEHGLIKERGQQRSDSTRVLAAIQKLNRLESVGETLRYALNSLAVVVPDWLRELVPQEWFERYGQRFDQWHLPDDKTEREALGEVIGRDGHHLLQAVYGQNVPAWLRQVPAVEILRRVWIQQYYIEGETVRWRGSKTEGLPPAAQLIVSPYDVDARMTMRKRKKWTGYVVHLTETCEDELPLLITNVETCASTTTDGELTEVIHQHLAEKDLLPEEHLVDQGYVDSQVLLDSKTKHGVDLIGPMPSNTSWQARAGQGFDQTHFIIDWEAQQVTCPQGQSSTYWKETHDRHGNPVILVQFAKQDCQACPQRVHCTRAREKPRRLKLRPRDQYLALQEARQRQETTEFKEKYKRRAGVEGTVSQGVRGFGLRRSRYTGLPKTHLQHVFTALAMNLVRLADWFVETPRAQTRCSRFAALACT
jgi:transposase